MVFFDFLKRKKKLADDFVPEKSIFGRQKEKEVAGQQKFVRKEDEKFQGKLKDVNLEEMHEEYYDVDALNKS